MKIIYNRQNTTDKMWTRLSALKVKYTLIFTYYPLRMLSVFFSGENQAGFKYEEND
jgi:hypothetical protein